MKKNGMWFIMISLVFGGQLVCGTQKGSFQCYEGVTLNRVCQCLDDGDNDHQNTFDLKCEGVASGDDLAEILTYLKDGTRLVNLEVTDSPGIESLPDNLFAELSVSAFRMSETSVSALNKGIFNSTYISDLTSVHLQRNAKLEDVQWDWVALMVNLQELQVSYSPKLARLEKQFPLVNISYINYSYNGITMIDDDYFSQLKDLGVLLLGHNELQTLGKESCSSEGLYLDIGYNLLSEGGSAGDLAGIPPKELILSGNGITHLYEGTYKELLDSIASQYPSTNSDSVYVLMNDNPLECDCSMKWFPSYENRGLVRDATCVDGRLVQSLTPADFADCP